MIEECEKKCFRNIECPGGDDCGVKLCKTRSCELKVIVSIKEKLFDHFQIVGSVLKPNSLFWEIGQKLEAMSVVPPYHLAKIF